MGGGRDRSLDGDLMELDRIFRTFCGVCMGYALKRVGRFDKCKEEVDHAPATK